MSRNARLQSGKAWLQNYKGSNITKGYSNWFGVSKVCAILELRMLGVSIPDEYLKQAKLTEQQLGDSRARKKKGDSEKNNTLFESDENFCFIAGHTSGGVPYGVTWEEADSVFESDYYQCRT